MTDSSWSDIGSRGYLIVEHAWKSYLFTHLYLCFNKLTDNGTWSMEVKLAFLLYTY